MGWYVTAIRNNGQTPPDYLQLEIDNYLENRNRVPMNYGDETLVYDENNDIDDIEFNEPNDDWMEGVQNEE